MANVGRPPILDDAKKREICGLVFAGCSRNVAAQYVGCSRRTIRNAARTVLEKARGQCAGDTRPEPRDVAGPSQFFPRATCNNSADREENMPPLFPVAAPQLPQNAPQRQLPQGNNDGSFGPQLPNGLNAWRCARK